MTADSTFDYAILDRPEVLSVLFHPRRESPSRVTPNGVEDIRIPVDTDIDIGASFHMTDKDAANILFFHGNGEIVSDYDDLGPLLNSLPANFMVVDYRGYGRSSGHPTVTAMMTDSHKILEFVVGWLMKRNYSGPLIVMGRSLGSASALELAYRHAEQIAGLVIESGFAYAGPLLQLLGVNPESIKFKEQTGFANLQKIRSIPHPTLIIHAELDHIIPFSDGQALYDNSAARQKTLLKIADANHNNIFMVGLRDYLGALKDFVSALST